MANDKFTMFTIEDINRAQEILNNSKPRRSAVFNPYEYPVIDGMNPCAEVSLSGLQLNELTGNWNKTQSVQNAEGGTVMFNLEDRVIITKNEYPQLVGKVGIIKDISQIKNGNSYGVVLEEFNSGHDLDGKCAFGHGWYVLESELDLENKSKLCRMIVKNEEMIKSLKLGSDIGQNGIEYNVRKNGALTFLTQDSRKVFVYKDEATTPLILNCISEDDRIVLSHLMEAFRILPMKRVYSKDGRYGLLNYTQKESDEVEAEMFQVVSPVQETPVVTVFEQGKKFETEEELYALMGLTKK